MKLKYALFSLLVLAISQKTFAQPVTVQIDANAGKKTISLYIYGKNNCISADPGSPTTGAEWKMMREAGLRYMRENEGNDATKYNWRKKISSHPDWYNNVYNHDWDYEAKTLQDSMPGVQGMWAFQLIGYAARNTTNNFNDFAYNGSAYWSGVCQNLAGGGTANGGGGCNASVSGNTNLYLKPWTDDSTVAILDHWFGMGGLGYNQNQIKYWSMDNEPDGWDATHDDVMPTLPTAEGFMQLYFAVAKKARAKFPNIKLTGPIPMSEWQWYTWNNSKITVLGTDYNWLEFFIKRCAEEQTLTGIRLLDVIDIHSYPNENNNADIVQGHRVYFDTTYNYPGANGCKTTDISGWNSSITQEYIFGRCNKWLNQYMGAGHGVTCGVTEFGLTNNNANVTGNSYSSILGTFADNNVELFTPWYWYPGMWETLHLFSRYAKTTRVQSVSSNELDVSGYSSVNTVGDSMTVILVNRNLTTAHVTNVNLTNFTVPNGNYTSKQLKNLPSSETFVSHTTNALSTATVTVNSNSFSLSLPALSTTAIILKGTAAAGVSQLAVSSQQILVYPNPASGIMSVELRMQNGIQAAKHEVQIMNMLGEEVIRISNFTTATSQIDISQLQNGIYFVSVRDKGQKIIASQKIVVQH